MIIGMKCTNEIKNIDLIIGDFHDEDWVEQIIVIDGGSNDGSIEAFKKYNKCRVHIHPWISEYHDQEIMQSNILMSYIPYDKVYFILDFDEKMSQELKDLLRQITEQGMPVNENNQSVDTMQVSRQSFELMRYENSPYAIKGEDGWWIKSHMIGQYPDFQLRIIKRKVGMHWVNSPHHILFGLGTLYSTAFVKTDIIHYHGKEDCRQREHIEKQWASNQLQRKKLGLVADLFDTRLSPEMFEYIREKEKSVQCLKKEN